MKHQLTRHKHPCKIKNDPEQHGYCHLCDGDWYYCIKCKVEGEHLTTHCPGEKYNVQDVCDGKIDFVNGKWYDLKQKLSWTDLKEIYFKIKKQNRFDKFDKEEKHFYWELFIYEKITESTWEADRLMYCEEERVEI